MVKTTSKSKYRQALDNTVFCDCHIMRKLHVKTSDNQPMIHKQYELYIYASEYKGKLPLQFCSVKLFLLPMTDFYGLSKDVGSEETAYFKHWNFQLMKIIGDASCMNSSVFFLADDNLDT